MSTVMMAGQTLRRVLAFCFIVVAALLLVPTSVPTGVFSDTDLSTTPPVLLAAARYRSLANYAVSIAVSDHVEPGERKRPLLETLITNIRGRVFSGEAQMAVFALERGYVTPRIRGWQAAASQCLAKSAEELTLADAVILLIHMNSPTKNWSNQEGELLEHRNAYLTDMSEKGYISEESAVIAALSPLAYCRN